MKTILMIVVFMAIVATVAEAKAVAEEEASDRKLKYAEACAACKKKIPGFRGCIYTTGVWQGQCKTSKDYRSVKRDCKDTGGGTGRFCE